jgi:hypothetical protein
LEVVADSFVGKVCTGALEFESWRDMRQALTVCVPEQSAVVLPWLIAHLAAVTKDKPDRDASGWSALWSELLPSINPRWSRHPESVAVIHTFAAAALEYDRPIVLESLYHNDPISRAAEILSLCLVPPERGPETLAPDLIPAVRAKLIAALGASPPSSYAVALPHMLMGFPEYVPAYASKPVSSEALAWALDNATAVAMSKMAGTGVFQIRTPWLAASLFDRIGRWSEGDSALARTNSALIEFYGSPSFVVSQRITPTSAAELGYTCCSARAITALAESLALSPLPGFTEWLGRTYGPGNGGTVRNLLSSLEHGLSLPRLVRALASVLGPGEFPPGSGSTLAHLALEVSPFASTMAALLSTLGPSIALAQAAQGRTPYAVALEAMTTHPADFDADELQLIRAELDRVVLQYTGRSPAKEDPDRCPSDPASSLAASASNRTRRL